MKLKHNIHLSTFAFNTSSCAATPRGAGVWRHHGPYQAGAVAGADEPSDASGRVRMNSARHVMDSARHVMDSDRQVMGVL